MRDHFLRGRRWRLALLWAFAASLCIAFPSALPAAGKAEGKPPRPMLVGYFPQWGVYNQYFVKTLVTNGAVGLLDQMDYSQGVIKENRCAIGDQNADLNFVYTAANSVDGVADVPAAALRGNFHQLQKLRRIYPKLKVLLSIEGDPAYFASAARPENRVAFVSSCISMFIEGHLASGVEGGRLFDGFDLDWEFPAAADTANYLALVQEFRRQLDAFHAGFKLSVAWAPGLGRYNGLNFKAIADVVDQINMMNYDYNGPWSHTTGILAPLYAMSGDPLHNNNIDATFESYVQAGVPAEKMLLGIPFYAYGWSGVTDVNHGLFQQGQPIRGDHFYSSMLSIAPKSKLYRDPASQTPWLYDGNNFWTFDDPVSIRAKLEFAHQQKLGGVMVWELSNDSADAVLLRAIAAELHARSAP